MRSKPILRLSLSGGLALLCATASVIAAAPRRPAFPHYDVIGLCDTGLGGMRGRILEEMCVRPERDARAELARRWSMLPAQALNQCLEQQRSLRRTYGGSGSYQGLRSCVNQTQPTVDEVPPTEQRAKAPARRGTTATSADRINAPPTVGTGVNTGTGLGTLGTPGLGTPGTGAGGTGTSGLGYTGQGTTGIGTTGTGATGAGSSGLGTGGGSTGGGTAGGAGSSGGGR